MLIRLRTDQPVLHRRKFFQGRPIRGLQIKDISWLDADGNEMGDESWHSPQVRYMGVRLAGDIISDVDEKGNSIVGDTLLILLNGSTLPKIFALPSLKAQQHWEFVTDTALNDEPKRTVFYEGDTYLLQERSLAVLRTVDVD